MHTTTMIIQLNEIKKGFGSNEILSGVNAIVSAGDRIAIIGQNGAGKTTLLKILTGEYYRDDGELHIAKGLRIGYLSQHNDFVEGSTVLSEMKSAYSFARQAVERMREIEQLMANDHNNAELIAEHDRAERIVLASDYYNADTRINVLLNGFGFDKSYNERKTAILSGGEATRLRLAKLLLNAPDVLLLDEPTNHLDFATISFLEQELMRFKGSIISVTHDRAYIDNVCNIIWEIEDGKVEIFKGRFENYVEEKNAGFDLQQKQHDADVKTAKKLEDYIARNKVRASTAKMAKSREKQLAKLTIADRPKIKTNRLKFGFDICSEPYKEVLTCKNLYISAGEKQLIDDVDFSMLKQEKIILAGENGSGKSTLLRALAQEHKSTGSIRFGIGTELSIFRQHQQLRSGRVIDAIRALRPKFTEQEARDLLAKFMFRGDEVFADCTTLSGGESARLRLAEMTLERSNFLMMDEPTNHLDLFTHESLTEALCGYEGTLLIVSHDRYLMTRLDCPIYYIKDKKLTRFERYDDMSRWFGAKQDAPTTPVKETVKNKAEDRKKRAAARQRLREVEMELESSEKLIAELTAEMQNPDISTNHGRLAELARQIEDAHKRHDDAYLEWDELIDEDD